MVAKGMRLTLQGAKGLIALSYVLLLLVEHSCIIFPDNKISLVNTHCTQPSRARYKLDNIFADSLFYLMNEWS